MVTRNPEMVPIRRTAVQVGLRYADSVIREVGHENRGPVVDRFLRMARIERTTGDTPQAAQDREWCGAFVYGCYLEAVMGRTLADLRTVPLDPFRARLPFPADSFNSGYRVGRYGRTHRESVVNTRAHPPERPEFGDIFALESGHVGMVVEMIGDAVARTVEGNQADLRCAQNGVLRLERPIASFVSCVGF